jgi:thymidine phosphorylase
MAEDAHRDKSRPQLKVRRISLDTGRENVIVISRHSNALRPDVFRGFSRVELRRNSRVLLATLLITDEDALVGPMKSAFLNRRSGASASLQAAWSR